MAEAHGGVPVAGSVRRLCGRGPQVPSLPSLSRGRSTFALAPSAAEGPLSALGTCGAPAASARGGGCPRGFARAGWAGGSRAPVPPLSAGPPGSDCPEQGSWGPLSPLCAPQSCGGQSPLPVGHSAGGRGSPALAGSPRGSGHGDHDLAGTGGTPWLCAPLPTSHEVPCLPSPGVPARAGLSGVGQPCCASVSSEPAAAVPAGPVVLAAGPAWHCPARRGVLRWHRSQSCSGGTESPPTPPERTGAATVGKQRHEAAPEGSGKSCRSPRRTPCPCGAMFCCGFLECCGGGRGIRGIGLCVAPPPLGTGWPHMALQKLWVVDGCVRVLGTPDLGAGGGQTLGPGQGPVGTRRARWAEPRGRWP